MVRSNIVLCIAVLSLGASVTHAAEVASVPSGATDSDVCSVVKENHDKGLARWSVKDLIGALEYVHACENTLKKRGLWAGPELGKDAKGTDTAAYQLTNQVIFSLACLYQQIGNNRQSAYYAKMARERSLIAGVSVVGARK